MEPGTQEPEGWVHREAVIHGVRLHYVKAGSGTLVVLLHQRDFRRVIRRASLPRIRFHALRHCCATLLLRQGVHPKVVGEQLGHASVGVTLDVYSHILPGMREDATRTLAARLVGNVR